MDKEIRDTVISDINHLMEDLRKSDVTGYDIESIRDIWYKTKILFDTAESIRVSGSWYERFVCDTFKSIPISKGLQKHQKDGVDFVINQLDQKHKDLVLKHYKEGLTLRAISGITGHSYQRVSQLISEARYKLSRDKLYEMYILYGPEKALKEYGKDPKNTPLYHTTLSVRTCNSLRRAGINTAGEILNYSREDLMKIRNLGKRCVNEISSYLKVNGLIDKEDNRYDTL